LIGDAIYVALLVKDWPGKVRLCPVTRPAGKAVQYGECPLFVELEDDPLIPIAASLCSAVEVEFAKAQRQRKKVEALFAELKNQIGLRRLRSRRIKFVSEQFFMAAAAQNIKRLVRFLSQGPTPALAVTA
jgi:hypothetical protein